MRNSTLGSAWSSGKFAKATGRCFNSCYADWPNRKKKVSTKPRNWRESRPGPQTFRAKKRIEFASVRFAFPGRLAAVAIYIFQASRFASKATKIVELRPPHFGGPRYFYPVDDAGTGGEDTLDTLSEADLADGETGLGSIASRDDDAFERLNPLFVAFFDLDVHLDGVPGNKIRQIGAFGFG